MPGQFKVKNGLIIDNGGIQVTGSISSTAGITGSFSGSIAGFPTDVSGFSSSLSSRITSTEATASQLVTASGSLSARISSNEAKTGSFATTGSNQFNGSQTITGSLTATGTIIAQTLVIQTVTSSIVYSSGSNIFGLNSGNSHQFTGSVLVSGSIGIGTTNPLVRFHVTQPNGVGLPTLGTSTGGLFIAGDGNQYGLYVGNDGNTGNAWIQSMRNNTATAYNILLNPVGGSVGIGTTSPGTRLEILSRAADADRTLPHNVLTLTAEQGNAPYGGFGGAVLFKNRSYTSGMVESSRIRSVIYDDGAPNNFGGGLWFETTPTPGGTLTPSLVLNYQGRVGIGTTAPTEILHLNRASGTGTFIRFQDTGGGGVYIGGRSETMELYAGGTERMRITGGAGNDLVIGFQGGNPYTAASRGSIFLNGSSNSLYGWGTGGTARGYMYHNGTNVFLENSVSGGNFNIIQVGAGNINFSTNAATRMAIQPDGGVVIGRKLGNQYSQTSSTGTTSIVDTGITYNTGDYGGYGRGATYQVVFNGNPNAGGSGAYYAQHMGIITIYTGWSGSAVTTYINYTQLAVGNNISTLTLTPHFWNGSSQVSSVGVYTEGYQIRLRIDGYNSSYVGSDQAVYLTKLT